jgi:C-terminal processing protease CtpA/Prc
MNTRALILTLSLSLPASAQIGTRLLRQPDISGERIAFIYAGDLWTASRDGSSPHRLTSTAASEESPKFSPDGNWIAFSRNGNIFLVPASGGAERRLTWHPAYNRVVGWTPSGKDILIHSDRLKGSITQSPHLFLLPMEGGVPRPLPMPRATQGSFSSDGKSIAYGPNPEIVLWTPFKRYRGGSLGYIAIYDLEKSAYDELPRTNANDVFPMWHGGAIYFVSDRTGVMNLYRYGLKSKQTDQLTTYTEWDVKNPSKGKDAIIYENGGWLYAFDLKSGSVHQVAVSLPSEALPKVEDQTKWQRALDDAWHAYSDHAFAPVKSWQSLKPRYQELMKWAADASDAEYVLGEMLGEAGQSHIQFGSAGPGEHGPGLGLLGADYVLENGHYRLKKIYRGEESDGGVRGPLAVPGLKISEGDYLLDVNGKAVDTATEIYSAFDGLAGQKARITINQTPSEAGAREVEVTPLANERALRMADWARENRARVAEASGGRVGYIYIADVDPEGEDAFRKDWDAQRYQVDAMIVDVRNCTGGIRSVEIFNVLAAKPTRRMYDRRRLIPPLNIFFDGPKVMIANDQSVSGCDELPMFFKHANIGPVVGTRTFGGMIASGATYDIAGVFWLRLPEYGFYSSETGWSPENFGVEPDFKVELQPSAAADGDDPQLEKAIELARKAVSTYQKTPAPPPYAQAPRMAD